MKATRWAEGSRTAMFSKMLKCCQQIGVRELKALEARTRVSPVGLHLDSSHGGEGGGVCGIGGNLDEQPNRPKEDNDLPSLQRASNTSV